MSKPDTLFTALQERGYDIRFISHARAILVASRASALRAET